MQTPDFMPVLGQGKHAGPHQGACVMEYISILAGEEFSDSPQCTDVYLCGLARTLNDCIPDEHRHLLLPLIPRLMKTGGTNIHGAFLGGLLGEWERRLAETDAVMGDERDAEIGVQLLSERIDEYWKLRREPEPQDDELTAADYELMVTAVKQ